MTNKAMSNRRQFLLGVTANVTATAISGLAGSRRVLGANDRVRLGLIGAGGRGKEILREALACPNTEAVAVADIYTRRHDEVKSFAPAIKAYTDFRHLLDDSSIDAVLIASPQHLHALHFVPALEAGKDVYQEKTMAFNVDHAKRMRRAGCCRERGVCCTPVVRPIGGGQTSADCAAAALA